MKNIHNVNIFNTSLEEVLKLALFYKDEQERLRKKTNDYSGLQSALANELYIDGGVVRTRKKDRLGNLL
tara:strand:+ start:5420 stop:5626 length:207 start_codon:yes stop_codon:yes gene_type:complete